MAGCAALLRGTLLFLIAASTLVHSESHWESYYELVESYRWICYPYYYTYCVNWNYYGYYLGYQGCGCQLFRSYASYCYTQIGYNCFVNCLGWTQRTLWRCSYGWKGANCDIPVCDSPSCASNQVCVRPNVCDCLRSSATGECQIAACNSQVNCYPGSCSATTGSCVCPPGFTGSNCQTITTTPDINSCSVQVLGTPGAGNEQVVAEARECAAPGLDPLPIWIGASAAYSLTKILVAWEADYNNQLPLPDRGRAPYINNAPVPIGIVESNFTVSFQNNNVSPRPASCINIDPSTTNPQPIVKCNPIMQWADLGASSLIRTNATFIVSIEAQVGGAKKGDQSKTNGDFGTQVFSKATNMNTTTRTVKFAFDLEAPFHCLSTSSSNNCPVFPIFLNQTMTSNPVIQPTFNAWNDAGSGISRFHAEVFFMQQNTQSLLEEIGKPLISTDVNITLNNFRYTCSKPGAYSIVLTVYDKANNSAKARKIFNYDPHDTSVQETDSPVYLDKANPANDYLYITDLEKLQNPDASYQFNLVWTGHFETTYKQESLGAVKPWETDIDDNQGTKYGLRSVDAFPVKSGLIGYELAYSVDGSGKGGVGLSPPNSSAAISDASSTSAPVTVNSTLKDGDAIVTWLRFYDLYGKPGVVRKTTYVDTSKFNTIVTGDAVFKKHYPEQYNSSVVIPVQNQISGIKNITYQIKDNTRNVVAYSGFMIPRVLSPPSSFSGRRRRRTVETPCYPTDKTCYCIPSGQCFDVTQLINIDNCWIDKGVAGDRVTVLYTIVTYSGYTLDGSVDAGVLSLEDIACRPVSSTLSQEAKIGIGIACFIIGVLLILLIILLVLMFIRWKVYKKHPVPRYIRTSFNTRFGRRTPDFVADSNNKAYVTKEDVESLKSANTAGHGIGGSSGHLTVSAKDVQMGEVVAEGRFAVVRQGFVSRGNEQIAVAVKVLRSGYDKGDPEVMRSKIAFMANKVKPHPNIIRFIGSVVEDKNQAAPAMLLELCDKSLKDWLSEISDVDKEVSKTMLHFSLQIARGAKHLHEQGIIHRRLAVRNVLLKQTFGGHEVKLIGFGPAKDDDQSTALVPFKWMAPETLETLDSVNPVYTKETDVWSYGVTVWEIFSKGEAPYANHRSPDIGAALKRGERLTCPEHCPPDLFDQVLHPCWNSNPRERPNFSKICSTIDRLHNGSNRVYYAASEVARGNHAPAPVIYYSSNTVLNGNASRLNNSTGMYSEARSS